MARKSFPVATVLVAAAVVGAAACSASHSSNATGGPSADGGTDAAPMPFQADSPQVYVAKVKNLLVGQPPTDAEVKAVESDPTQLASLIQQWQQQPEYETKMQRFFELALEQTQVSLPDFADQAYPQQIDANQYTGAALLENLQESYARTANYFTQNGQPLTNVVTSHQVMMTTALKELYAFLDTWEVSDTAASDSAGGQGKVTTTDHWKQANPNVAITVEASAGPIALSDTLDPSSPNYMHWYYPDLANVDMGVAGCATDPIVFPAKAPAGVGGSSSALVLHWLLLGAIDGHPSTSGTKCQQYGGALKDTQFQTGDFADWQLVTIRQPNQGEATSVFYDLGTLRSATTLVLNQPRAGFFSTPAFAANWQTNTSNTMRVTLNQTLIVSLGSSIDGTDMTLPTQTPGLDTTHANQAACYTCHRLLDPTRSILASAWSWNYHQQLDTNYAQQPGLFAFRGVINPNIKSIDDFASTIASHPYFGPAWVQKLCYYANSSPCVTTDPVFTQIEKDFEDSKFDWNKLVVELMSSPIVTNASSTLTSQTNGEIVAVSRRDHLCAAINERLGFTDVCGLSATTTRQYAGTTIPQVAAGLPSDGYGRGSVAPVLPNQPTLFFRAGTENICEALAAETIDVKSGAQITGTKTWSSSDPTSAITDFVGIVMGLVPSDPRYAQAQTILTDHFNQAKGQSGITPTAALQSTFVAACLAPSAVSIGM
ncbi:MAG TPA: hypothetical protein VMI75_36785 [Polyangiaceae bacterium]|nr:hypothetical protein [Polyangiaceae bacterium]